MGDARPAPARPRPRRSRNETDEQARAFRPPLEPVAELTDDPRFTGGSLVQAPRHDLLAWLAEYSITLKPQE
jgi:hypothetical protein